MEIARFVQLILFMRLYFLVLFFLPIGLIAQQNCVLSGEGWGSPNNTSIRLIRNGESAPSHETQVVSGKFSVAIPLKEPTLYFVLIGKETKPVELFLEPGAVVVRPKKGQPGEYDVTGSRSHVDFRAFIDRFLPIVQQNSQLVNQINNATNTQLRDSLMPKYERAQTQLQYVIDSTLDANPASPILPFVLTATHGFNDDPNLLEGRFKRLSPELQAFEAGQEVARLLADSKVGAVGTLALDFTQDDENGNPISLSSFRGKYVLVDFWASWCGPCRSENPNVVDNFNKFKKKNFTVLGVSLDRPGQKERWLQAIKEDNLTWTHVSDLKFWDNAVAKKYKIQSIPQNLLVDPSGVIIAKNLRGEALGQKLCEILGCD